jgi:hypothetical protein
MATCAVDGKLLRRYMVAPSADAPAMTIPTKTQQLFALNERGLCSFSREEIVKMVDEALVRDGD